MKKAKRLAAVLLAMVLLVTSAVQGFAVQDTADVGETGADPAVYTVSLETAEHGALSFAGSDKDVRKAGFEEGAAVTVTAEPAEGYTLATVSLLDENGIFIQAEDEMESVYDEDTGITEFSFLMPACDVYVSTTFTLYPEEYSDEYLEEMKENLQELESADVEETADEGTAAEAMDISLESHALTTYSLMLTASTTTTFSRGTNHKYLNYSTYEGRATWEGTSCITYCVEPSKNTPKAGTYSVSEWSSDLARAACYYGYGGPGFDSYPYGMFWQLFGGDTSDSNYGFSYCYSHLAVSWIYDDRSDDSDAFKGVTSEGTISAIKNVVNAWATEACLASVPSGFKVYTFNYGSSSTQTECFFYMEPNGELYVQKVSSNTTVTSNNSAYSLAGAKYQVFSTEAEASAAATGNTSSNSNALATLTTDSGGNTETVSLEAGTYYVKEIVASKGYKLDTAVHSVTVTSGGTATVTSTEVPETGTLIGYKYSEDNSLMDGNSEYSLANGATFGVYNNSACTGTAVATITLNQYDSANKRAYGSVDGLAYGTYWVKEITAPKGYYLDTEDPQQVTIGSTVQEVSVSRWDKPITVTVELTKEADLDDVAVSYIVGGDEVVEADEAAKQNELALHDDYSLKGAIYGLYSDSSCTDLLETLTTDADGKATSTVTLPLGTYYVKEIQAPENYEISDEMYTVTADSTVVSESNSTVEVTVSDPVIPGKVIVYKSSDDPSLLEDYPDYYSLEGAEYTVYYNAACSRIAGVITIDENGYGELDGILYGTVYVKETKAPSCGHFAMDETLHTVVLDEDNSVKAVTSTDTPTTRTLYVCKGPLAMLETGEDFDADIPASATSVVFTKSKTIPESYTSSNQLTDVSYAQNGGIMAWLEGTTWYVQAADAGTIYFNYDCYKMFCEETYYANNASRTLHTLTSIDFGSNVIDTSHTTDMSRMFYNCNSLTSVSGLTQFDTSSVETMDSMFFDCMQLTVIDISSFDTSNVTYMGVMFAHCQQLETITTGSGFDTSNVEDFHDFLAYTNLDNDDYQELVEKISIDSATNLYEFFAQGVASATGYASDYTLTDIDLSSWDFAGVANMNRMFNYCSNLERIQGLEIPESVTSTAYMFNQCNALGTQATTIAFHATTDLVTYSYMFRYTSTEVTRKNAVKLSCSDTSGVAVAKKCVDEAKVDTTYCTNTAGTTIKNNIIVVWYDNAVQTASLGSSVMTALAGTGSAVKDAFTSATESISNGMALASAADKLSLTVEAEAAGTTRLDNATYAAYYDADFIQWYANFTFKEIITDDNGEETAVYEITGIPWGLELYVREEIPSTGFDLDPDTYEFAADAGDGNYVNSTEPPTNEESDHATIKLYKSSADTTVTANNSSYSLAGAVYTVYTDKKCTTVAKDEAGINTLVLVTNEYGYAELTGIKVESTGTTTYYVKETTAPEGFRLDTNVYEVLLSKDSESEIGIEMYGKVESVENPVSGYLYVNKRSSDTSVGANDGEDYSYEGAQYTVYTDEACTAIYDVMTTGSTGRGSLSGVPFGTYYIKETVAPAGYELSTEVCKAVVALNSSGNAATTTYYTLNASTGEYEKSSTSTFTAYDNPVTGSLTISKYSADTAVTDGNSNYSLEGAVFELYESDGKTVYTTLTTDADGYASISGVPLGTYYVKETTASKGFKVNNASTEVVLTRANSSGGKTYTVPVAETPATVTVSVAKSSADPDATDNNDNYTLEGAVFGIFSDEACSACVSTMTTDADGKATSAGLAIGTYYIREMQAPAGFELDSTVYQAVCAASGVKYTNLSTGVSDSSLLVNGSLSVTEGIETAKIRVYKESGNRSLTGSLDTYTLEGAVYGVYASESDAANDVVSADGTGTLGLGYLTTDEYGTTEYLEGLAYGTYYVKETLAPAGFELDTATYTADLSRGAVDSDKAVELSVTDTAASAPTLRIMKESTQDDAPGPLSGAQFVIQYYDGSYSTQDEIQAASPATKYWVIETKEVNGEYVAELTDDYLLDGSDSLFYDENGDVVLPVGTYTIYESLAPDLYSEDGDWYDSDGDVLGTLDGSAVLVQVKQDEETGIAYIEATAEGSGSGLAVTLTEDGDGFVTLIKEDMALGSITIIKNDKDGKLLEGVTYSLYKHNELTDAYEFVVSATTGSDGSVLFDELGYGTYKVVETATLDGYSLLAEPVIVTIPYEISVSEAEELGADMSNAIISTNGKTCYFVDLTYTITDSSIIGFPMTGASAALPGVLCIGLGIMAIGLFLLFRHKKTKTVNQ